MQCPFYIKIGTTQDEQRLVIKLIINEHNHEVSQV